MQQLINGQYYPHRLPYIITSTQHVWNKVQQLNSELICKRSAKELFKIFSYCIFKLIWTTNTSTLHEVWHQLYDTVLNFTVNRVYDSPHFRELSQSYFFAYNSFTVALKLRENNRKQWRNQRNRKGSHRHCTTEGPTGSWGPPQMHKY